MYEDLNTLLGKRIVGAVCKRGQPGSYPASQLFLILDDGTHFEFYAHESEIEVSGTKQGGFDAALEYMSSRMKTVYISGIGSAEQE